MNDKKKFTLGTWNIILTYTVLVPHFCVWLDFFYIMTAFAVLYLIATSSEIPKQFKCLTCVWFNLIFHSPAFTAFILFFCVFFSFAWIVLLTLCDFVML